MNDTALQPGDRVVVVNDTMNDAGNGLTGTVAEYLPDNLNYNTSVLLDGCTSPSYFFDFELERLATQ